MSKIFVPRKTIPAKTNKFYLRTVKGGYSQCIAGKPLKFDGSVLSNCVGYAWGRVAELEDDPKCTIGVPSARLKAGTHNPTSAYAWMNYTNGRKTGKTPKLGAVCVWKSTVKSNYGHVAVVEEIYSDGSWLSSESAYGGTTFSNRKYNKNCFRANYKFLGFIYPNVDFVLPNALKVGDKVKITAKGNSKKDGKGKACGGVGWTRYILAVHAGAKYPYQVGSKSRITTGYYKEDALKKA